MKCPSCGADNPPEAVVCGYCGSQRPLTAATEKRAVFARLRSSAAYADRNSPQRQARLPKLGALPKVFLSVFFVMFIGGAAVAGVVALGMAGVFGFLGFHAGEGLGALVGLVPLMFAAVPLAFVVLGVFLWRKTHQKMDSIEHDPLQAIPVIVVDKRTHVSGGSGDSSASTRYFVTCESEDGSRQEYPLWSGTLYGRMTADDAGILFVRGGCALDFDRV